MLAGLFPAIAVEQWTGDGGSSNWTNPENWLDETVAEGAGAIAQFPSVSFGAMTDVLISANLEIGTLVFYGNSPHYQFSVTGGEFRIHGGVGNAVTRPNFNVSNFGYINFYNSASAGNATYTAGSDSGYSFADSSSAGSAHFTVAAGGTLELRDNATAAGATISASADGSVNISNATTGISIGSLAGEGNVNLGGKVLTLGELNTHDTISGTISGPGGSLMKVGSGTLTFAGINTYTGGTTIRAGTLTATHDDAAGTGRVAVEGGVFLVETGATVANEVFLSGGSYRRSLGADADLAGTINATSSFVDGRPDTTAEILQGTLSAQGTLVSSFQEHSAALNDALRQSDVYSLHGTGNDQFVLQLSMIGLTSSSYLGWLDSDTGSVTYNQWINAINGNSGGTPTFFSRAYNAATDFHLGYYGVDVAAGTVWAVLDHNSDFAIVPEPATWGLMAAGLLFLAFHRRREVR